MATLRRRSCSTCDSLSASRKKPYQRSTCFSWRANFGVKPPSGLARPVGLKSCAVVSNLSSCWTVGRLWDMLRSSARSSMATSLPSGCRNVPKFARRPQCFAPGSFLGELSLQPGWLGMDTRRSAIAVSCGVCCSYLWAVEPKGRLFLREETPLKRILFCLSLPLLHTRYCAYRVRYGGRVLLCTAYCAR